MGNFRTNTLINEEVSAAVTKRLVAFPDEYHLAVQFVWDGTLTATVTIEESVDGENWATSSVTAGPAGSPGVARAELDSPYPYLRAVVSGVTGSGNLKVIVHGKN